MELPYKDQKGLEVCYCLWGCHPDLSLGLILGRSRSIRGPKGSRPHSPCALFYNVSDPSRSQGGGHPGLVPSVPSRMGFGRSETDFLATSEKSSENRLVDCEFRVSLRIPFSDVPLQDVPLKGLLRVCIYLHWTEGSDNLSISSTTGWMELQHTLIPLQVRQGNKRFLRWELRVRV